MGKPDKEQKVDNLADMLRRAKGIVLSDFTGLNVQEMTELRRRCRESEVEYLVVKNTLARFAAAKAEIEDLIPYLTGPNGFTLGYEDALVPARVVHDFARESDKLTIKAGMFEGGVIGPEDVKRIALLPDRDVLLSQLLAQMNAPITGFACALKSMLTKLVYVLSQVKNVKPEQSETAGGTGESAENGGEGRETAVKTDDEDIEVKEEEKKP